MRIQRSLMVVAALTLAVGCTKDGSNNGGRDMVSAKHDLAGSVDDMATNEQPDLRKPKPDLAGADLAKVVVDDLAMGDDLAVGDDLATNDDLAGLDLFGADQATVMNDMTMATVDSAIAPPADIQTTPNDLLQPIVDMAPNGVCNNPPAPTVPLTTFHTTLTVPDSDSAVATVLPKVPLGYPVTGQVQLKMGAAAGLDSDSRSGGVTIIDAFTGLEYAVAYNEPSADAWVNGANVQFDFATSVPAGRYYIVSRISMRLTAETDDAYPGFVSVTRTDGPIDICNTTTYNPKLDALPSLKPRTITVTGLDKQIDLPSIYTSFDAFLAVESLDGKTTFSKTFTFYTDAQRTGIVFDRMMLPSLPGGYKVKATIEPIHQSATTTRANATNGWDVSRHYNLGDNTDFLTITEETTGTNTNALSDPDQAKLVFNDTSLQAVTGTINDPSGILFKAFPGMDANTVGLLRQLVNFQNPAETRAINENTNAEAFTDARTYRGWVRNGFAGIFFGGFIARVPLESNQGTIAAPAFADRENDWLAIITEPLNVTVNGTFAHDFDIPALADDKSREIKVTDNADNALGGYTLDFESEYFGTAPNRYALRTTVITDPVAGAAKGTATVHLVPGKYAVTVTAPQP